MQTAVRYASVQARTASRERLLVLLFQAALRHLRAAEVALAAGHRDSEAHAALGKAQDIVTELLSTLDHRVAPDLCAQLTDVYTATLVSITAALLNHKAQSAQDAHRILAPVAAAFEEAVSRETMGAP